MRSRFPFLMYGGLGAILLTVLDYELTPVLAKALISAGPHAVSKEIVPVLGVACLIAVGIPVLAGLLAARSSGFAFIGALAGGLVYVGYDILSLVLGHVVPQHATTPLDPNSLIVIGCQGALGIFFGMFGGLVGRHLYRERPSYQGLWAPPYLSRRSYDGSGAYPGPSAPPSGSYGAPPTYGAGYGTTPYAPPQYQSPPRYQPGGVPSPAAYPTPEYIPPPNADSRDGMPTGGVGVP